MRFTLTINLGNDAMQSTVHVVDALRRVATTMMLVVGPESTLGPDRGIIQDDNGNTVGEWKVSK